MSGSAQTPTPTGHVLFFSSHRVMASRSKLRPGMEGEQLESRDAARGGKKSHLKGKTLRRMDRKSVMQCFGWFRVFNKWDSKTDDGCHFGTECSKRILPQLQRDGAFCYGRQKHPPGGHTADTVAGTDPRPTLPVAVVIHHRVAHGGQRDGA